MAEASAITINSENQEEVIKAAEEAVKEHEGLNVEEQGETEETKEETEETQETQQEEKPDSLEIKEKSDDDEESEGEASIDTTALFEEFSENGALSDESTNKVLEALRPAFGDQAEDILSGFLAGQQAQVANVEAQAFAATGGAEQYTAMLEWAAENLPAEEIAAFNNAIKTDAAVLAVRGLYSQFQASGQQVQQQTQTSPKVTSGANTSAGVTELIHSNQQLAKLVSSREYQNDPGFRTQIDARIEASMKAGTLT